MKKYRICSDKKFKVNEDIILTNEIIHMISLIIRYKIFYKNNEIFTENNNTYLTVDNKHLHIDNFLKCSVDRNVEGFIKLEKINEEYLKKLGYTFDFEIIGYVKIVSDIPYDENKRVMDYQKISKKEFYKILTENIDSFDNADNKNCSFAFDYTEKVEGNMEIEVKKYILKMEIYNLKFNIKIIKKMDFVKDMMKTVCCWKKDTMKMIYQLDNGKITEIMNLDLCLTEIKSNLFGIKTGK